MASSEWDQYYEETLRETKNQWSTDEEAASGWKQVSFISFSAGRIKRPDGRIERRIRKEPRYVTITWYSGRPVTGKRGSRVDEKAAETFGESVPGEDQLVKLQQVLHRIQR
jgi:hypothetical protein